MACLKEGYTYVDREWYKLVPVNWFIALYFNSTIRKQAIKFVTEMEWKC